ncbi:MAG TPA: hypothetical protein VG674_12340 [Amycolatopsis sp.]|nr:hypothetical protein [Amycolatopsis sp.]
MFARAVWSSTLGCSVLLCAFGVVLVPMAVLAAVAAVIVVLLSFVSLCVQEAAWVERYFGPRNATARAMATLALVLGVVGLVIATLVVLVGPATALTGTGLLMTAAAWSGWRVRASARRPAPAGVRRPAVRPKPADVPPDDAPVAVTSLSVDELCLAWRRSFVQLQHTHDEQARQALVAARQAYLDELERRDRLGFAKWLDSGPRAAGDPSRFVGRAE